MLLKVVCIFYVMMFYGDMCIDNYYWLWDDMCF